MSPADPDYFIICYNTWSLDPDRWEQVLSVPDLFSTDDARLWMPLVTQTDRRRVLAAFRATYKNRAQGYHNTR